MEVDFVHICTVGIIVLNESLTSDVPNFDGFVLRSTCNACAIRMELYRVNSLVVVTERVDHLSR